MGPWLLLQDCVRSAARAGAVRDRQPGSGENLPDHRVEHNDGLETLAAVK